MRSLPNFTFSFKKGKPLAIVRTGKYEGKVLGISTEGKDGTVDPAPRFQANYNSKLCTTWNQSGQIVTLARGFFEPVPSAIGRDILYVAGPSGAGKSVFCAMYAENFRRMWPKRPIYLFSRLLKDPSIDHVKGLKRIDINAMDGTENANIFANSLVIFDDIDTITNKKLKKRVDQLKDDLLQTGRHSNVYVILTSHLLNKSKDTRIIMQEMNKIVIFPNTGSKYFTNYCLKNYVGLETPEIQAIYKLPTRWVLLHVHVPRYVLYQSGAYLL